MSAGPIKPQVLATEAKLDSKLVVNAEAKKFKQEKKITLGVPKEIKADGSKQKQGLATEQNNQTLFFVLKIVKTLRCIFYAFQK
jgi:hypothetical protein